MYYVCIYAHCVYCMFDDICLVCMCVFYVFVNVCMSVFLVCMYVVSVLRTYADELYVFLQCM